jgi:hypothetical protein
VDYLEFLKNAIEETQGLKAQHVETVPVHEIFQGRPVWDGEVEVFHVTGHPNTETCFAWGYREANDRPELKAITVLGIPPIATPQKAVQAYVASLVRKDQK